MSLVRYFQMFLAFTVEMAMLVAYGRWAYLQGKSPLLKIVFVTVLVGAVVTVWGLFCAPKANYRLGFTTRLIVELLLFLTSSFLLYRTGATTAALLLGGCSCLTILLAYLLKM